MRFVYLLLYWFVVFVLTWVFGGLVGLGYGGLGSLFRFVCFPGCLCWYLFCAALCCFCGFICFRYFGRLGLLFNLNFGFYCWGLLLWFVVGV